MFAPEGMLFILMPLLFLIAALFLSWKFRKVGLYVLTACLLLITVSMLFFFRDPDRPLPEPDKIVAPVDGTVVEITENDSGDVHIAVFLSVFNVHAVRSPIQSKVLLNMFVEGEFQLAYKPEASRVNQHVFLELDTDYGLTMLKVISGAVARRVLVYPEAGDSLLPGEKIGFVRFGSRCEMDFPRGFETKIEVGDCLTGGVTEIGSFTILESKNE